jgi:hypothetical protein
MKGGVAAMALAATQRARTLERSAGLVLVRIAGEVTGADGAFDLKRNLADRKYARHPSHPFWTSAARSRPDHSLQSTNWALMTRALCLPRRLLRLNRESHAPGPRFRVRRCVATATGRPRSAGCDERPPLHIRAPTAGDRLSTRRSACAMLSMDWASSAHRLRSSRSTCATRSATWRATLAGRFWQGEDAVLCPGPVYGPLLGSDRYPSCCQPAVSARQSWRKPARGRALSPTRGRAETGSRRSPRATCARRSGASSKPRATVRVPSERISTTSRATTGGSSGRGEIRGVLGAGSELLRRVTSANCAGVGANATPYSRAS